MCSKFERVGEFSALENGYHSVWCDIECRTTTKKRHYIDCSVVYGSVVQQNEEKASIGPAIEVVPLHV